MKMYVANITCLVLAGLLFGCSQQQTTQTSADSTSSPAVVEIDGSRFLLTAEPEGASDVIKVRAEAQDQDDIVIVGRIGGSQNPWIDGRAAFSIVDNSLKACSDIDGDNCPKPWDYCCETPKLPTSTALVKIIDDDGELVKADAKTLLNVKELSTVVVTGKAERDDSGNLVVLASGVYVKTR